MRIIKEKFRATLTSIIKGFTFGNFDMIVLDEDTDKEYTIVINSKDLFNYVVDNFILDEYNKVTDFFYEVEHEKIDYHYFEVTIDEYIDNVVFESGYGIECFAVLSENIGDKVYHDFDMWVYDFDCFIERNCDK